MIPFYAEELGNIHVLRATISVDPVYNVAEKLQIKNNVLSLDDQIIADLSSVDMSISTNNLIVAQPDTPLREDEELISWEIKLNLDKSPIPLRSQQTEAKEWWSSKTLLAQKGNKQISCKHCHQLLVDTEIEYKIKDLPSEHWYELVECWICHETKPEEHKSRMKPILARPNLLLVGTTYFLIHTDNLFLETIQADATASARVNWNRGTLTKWIAINCSRCGNSLGEGQYCQEGDDTVLLSVKLYKYCVNIKPEVSEKPTFIDFFLSDLINIAKVHATPRFIIQGQQSHTPYALLWLFNWDTNIIHNNGYLSKEDHRLKRERVMKVFYLDCTDHEQSHVQKYLELWSNDKSTDQLFYPDSHCKAFMNELKTSTLILPPFMRQMNHPAMVLTHGFSIGFIHRSD